tara:strand:+ start:374 stop:589 length:216 start_codon:yes stop_codon:yes gene_type:complete
MKKLNKLEEHIKKLQLTPQQLVKDMNAILKLFKNLDKLENTDSSYDEFKKYSDDLLKKLQKRYPKHLDSKK